MWHCFAEKPFCLSTFTTTGVFAAFGANTCRYQNFQILTFAGGKKEVDSAEQPLLVSIFAWALILLGSVGILVVSTYLITTKCKKKINEKLSIVPGIVFAHLGACLLGHYKQPTDVLFDNDPKSKSCLQLVNY